MMKLLEHRVFGPLAILFAHFVILIASWFVLPSSIIHKRANDYLNRSGPVVRNMLVGKGFREANGEVMTRYPPGQPLYMYAIFWSADKLQISEESLFLSVSLFLQATSGMVFFLLLKEVWSVPVSAVISLVWLCYFPNLLLTYLGSNEAIYNPLFLLNVLLLWRAIKQNRPWLYFGSGLLLGIGMLIRPFPIALPAFVVMLLLTKYLRVPVRRRLIVSAWLLAGTLLAILPWQIWTFQHTRRVYLVSSVGVAGAIDGLTYGIPVAERIDLELPAGVLAVMMSAQQTRADGELTGFRDLFHWALDQLRTRPADFVGLFARKATRVWYATDSHRHELTLLCFQLPFLIVGTLGTACCLQRGGEPRRTAILWLVIIIFYWMMATAGLSILRYMVPVMPLVLFLSAPVVESALSRSGFQQPDLT